MTERASRGVATPLQFLGDSHGPLDELGVVADAFTPPGGEGVFHPDANVAAEEDRLRGERKLVRSGSVTRCGWQPLSLGSPKTR